MNGNPAQQPNPEDPFTLGHLPSTYQAIADYFQKLGQTNPFILRNETFKRIERTTGRPMICYVTKTRHVPAGVPAYIDDSDLTGFGDLMHGVVGEALDVFIVSNGGSAEASERIVRLLRGRFKSI